MMDAAEATVWVAAITSLGALLVSLANNHQNRKAKPSIEKTYEAVNSGRMDRIEDAVFETQKAVARLEGKVDAIDERST